MCFAESACPNEQYNCIKMRKGNTHGPNTE
jgi:hypothetical protein